MTTTAHDAEILDQFTLQADPFADNPAHSQQSLLAQALQAADVRAEHDVLDVACGPGLLAVALARGARRVTGIDVTPAMLARARREQAAAGLTNLHFDAGDARALPYPDERFDRVLTRFTFHHFVEPARVLAEMVRVCAPGGLVTVIDATPERDKRAAYDHVETLRDPSHASALTLDELTALFPAAGLADLRVERFRLPMALELQLAASFPREGDAATIRALLQADADAGVDTLSLAPHYQAGALWFAYPCAIVTGVRR